jgi:hypothetical protein
MFYSLSASHLVSFNHLHLLSLQSHLLSSLRSTRCSFQKVRNNFVFLFGIRLSCWVDSTLNWNYSNFWILKTTGDFVQINCIHFVMKTINPILNIKSFQRNRMNCSSLPTNMYSQKQFQSQQNTPVDTFSQFQSPSRPVSVTSQESSGLTHRYTPSEFVEPSLTPTIHPYSDKDQ